MLHEITAECFCEKDRPLAVDLLKKLEPKPKKPRLPQTDEAEWVKLKEIFGVTKIPAGAAQVIKQAVAAMMLAGDLGEKNKWQWLEYAAAEQLGGRDAAIELTPQEMQEKEDRDEMSFQSAGLGEIEPDMHGVSEVSQC